MQWMETHVVIQNRLGLHARPAIMFVDLAMNFQCEIRAQKNGSSEEIDAKSVMQVMMLAASQNERIKLRAQGKDAEEALKALADLVDRNFDGN